MKQIHNRAIFFPLVVAIKAVLIATTLYYYSKQPDSCTRQPTGPTVQVPKTVRTLNANERSGSQAPLEFLSERRVEIDGVEEPPQ